MNILPAVEGESSLNVWGNINEGLSVIQNADKFNHPVNWVF